MNDDIWRTYVDSLTWVSGHLDEASYYTFLRAGSLGIDAQTAVAEVANRIASAGDHPKVGKLKAQVHRAYQIAGSNSGEFKVGSFKKDKKDKLVLQPDKLQKIANRLDVNVTRSWLSSRSPLPVWNCSPSAFLSALYAPHEFVVVFDIFESQGCQVWTHGQSLDHMQKGHQNVWFLCNPCDGKFHWNPRQQKQSRRSEESITAWRFCVLESDSVRKDLWLKAIVQLPLPIVAINDSGGSSIHVLVLINASSKAEWDTIVRDNLALLIVPLGADYDAMTAVRLTRLPNCRRGQTGRFQSLLYLNPDPDYTPILELEAK
jgi:hypothetical protein